MGYDLYGEDPIIDPNGPQKPVRPIEMDYGSSEAEKYFNDLTEYQDKNRGVYFRNNVWWWRPLWEYTCGLCKDFLSEEDIEGGCHNGGHLITIDKALKIAEVLEEQLDSGQTAAHKLERDMRLDAQPDEECSLCKGTGVRDDEYVQGTCNSCHGKGTVRPFNTSYPFSMENVREFADFCKLSGGFSIH